MILTWQPMPIRLYSDGFLGRAISNDISFLACPLITYRCSLRLSRNDYFAHYPIHWCHVDALSNHKNDFFWSFSLLFSFFLFLDFSISRCACRSRRCFPDVHDVLDVTVRVTPMRFSSQLNPSLGLSPSIRLSRFFVVNRSPGAFGSFATGSSRHIASTSNCPRDQIYLFEIRSDKRKRKKRSSRFIFSSSFRARGLLSSFLLSSRWLSCKIYLPENETSHPCGDFKEPRGIYARFFLTCRLTVS